MKKRNKIFGLLIMMTMLILVVAACSSNDNTAGNDENGATSNQAPNDGEVYEENGLPVDEEVTIRVGFREQGYGREWFDTAVELFTDRFPNVTFDVTSTPNLGTILTPMVASGDDDEIYDLFYPAFEGADTFRELAVQGRFEPIDDLWDRELYDEPGVTLRDIIPESAYQVMSTLHGGTTTYNLPSGSYTAGLFFNDALFTEKGWNKNPQTWDEFLELLETIKQDGVIPITYPGMYPDYILEFSFDYYTWTMAHANGDFEEFEKSYQEVEQPFWTNEYKKGQYEVLYDLGQKGYFPAGVAALSHMQSQMQILRGEAAMVSSGDWIGNEMAESTPEGFAWGFMGIPFSNNADDPIYVHTSFGTTNPVIWKEKPELVKSWAKEFLLFWSHMDVAEAQAKASLLPQRIDFGDDPARLDLLDEVPRAVAEYVANNNVIKYDQRHTVTMTSPAFGQAEQTVFERVPGITTGQTDPIPVLEEAEEYISQAWADQE